MTTFFFYGTLCHMPLLEAVLGRAVETRRSWLADHAVFWADGESFPMIVESGGTQAEGLLVENLSDADVARLDFYEGGFAYHTREVAVEPADGGGAAIARVYFPVIGQWRPGLPWSLTDWAARWGDAVVATASDFMALEGKMPAERVLARYPMMLARGGSRVRAKLSAPADLRRDATSADVDLAASHTPYANFFAVEEYDLSFRRFDGTMSRVVNRAVFVSGDAATVLPYDPVRDRVMVIEQFRPGPYARGDRQPWQIEAIAGRIDPGESPEDAARREAREEAGVTLGALLPVAQYYPSTAAKSEFLYSFVGLTDLPDGSAGIAGVESEAEDIRAHLVSFDQLMSLIAKGEVANAPLILTALWLQRERGALRAGLGHEGRGS